LKKLNFFIIFTIFIIKNNFFYSIDKCIIDFNFCINKIYDNHPGIYNYEDKEFNVIFINSINDTLNKIMNSKTSDERFSIMENFLKKFNDCHLNIIFYNKINKKINKNNSNKLEYYNQFDYKLLEIEEFFYYLRLSSFFLNKNQENKFNKLLLDLKNIKKCKYIIFDIRNNGGGSTYYAEKILSNLFGERYFNQNIWEKNKNIIIGWRASLDNKNILKNYINIYKEKDLIIKEKLEKVYFGIEDKINKKENYFFEKEFDDEIYKYNKDKYYIEKINPNLNLKVIVLINNKVFSAALDFLDYLFAMNLDVLLIGEETSADTIYMECGEEELPSKLGIINIPRKFYIGRKRKNNEKYYPNIYKNYYEINDLKILLKEILKDINYLA